MKYIEVGGILVLAVEYVFLLCIMLTEKFRKLIFLEIYSSSQMINFTYLSYIGPLKVVKPIM